MKNIPLQTVFQTPHKTLFLLLLFSFFFPLAFALPLQDPIPGTYQCFVAGDDPFGVDVQAAGASLEIVDAATYRFNTNSATEEGTITVYPIEDNAVDGFMQGGSGLQLQPNTNSTPYIGMFFADNVGGHYVIIQNNNGVYIRCESEGADIAAVFNSPDGETVAEAPTETDSTPTSSASNDALANSTPTVKLGNTTIVASSYDPNNPDPEHIPMIDTYYCYANFYALEYGEGLTTYLREHTLEILPDNQYTFDGQAGEFRTKVEESYYQWISGPLNPTGETTGEYTLPYTADVDYSKWGSEITEVETPDGRIVDCFQQDAREQKALLDFALQQPVLGSYSCVTSGENPQQLSLELLPNNSYTFDGQEGSYSFSMGYFGTSMLWSSGPLNGDTTYTADDETGLRMLEFSSSEIITGAGVPIGSSSETSMVCESVVAANLIPKYSSTPADPPPAGAGGLDAFYVRNEFDPGNIFLGTPIQNLWYYYHFLPNGYVFKNGYVVGDECTKTYPNGQPVCNTYTVQGNTVTMSDGRQITLEAADNGAVNIDRELFEDKKLTGPQTLNGSYEYLDAQSASALEQSSGTGTNSVYTTTYTFSSDGSYSYAFGGWSQTPTSNPSGTLGEIGTLASSSSSGGDSGTYTIDGNIITFSSAKGYTKQCGFFFPTTGATTSVNFCGQEYLSPSEQ